MPAESGWLPAVCRWIIRLASWIVPRADRQAWVQSWHTNVWNWWMFLQERGLVTPHASARIVRHSMRAFGDAFRRRCEANHVLARLRRFGHRPQAVLAGIAASVALVGIVTAGFSGMRTTYAGLPYQNPRELVTFAQRDLLGQPYGVPSRAVRIWRDKSASFRGVTAFSYGKHDLDGQETLAARLTRDFFTVLGLGAARGRTLRLGDESAPAVPLVLTHDAWKRRFHADPRAIGRRATFDRQPAVIVGILPPYSWALYRRIEAFAPLNIDMGAVPPRLVGAIGRLKPGVSIRQARAELVVVGEPEHVRLLDRLGPELLPIPERWTGSLIFYAGGLVAGIVLGLVLVRVGKAMPRRGPHSYTWRYWAFLGAKCLLLMILVATLWIELTAYIQKMLDGRVEDFMTAALLGWVFFIASGVGIYWAFRDQRRRCPVCLDRLTLPVTIGSWSSAFFEPVSTEFLCERGHGSLCTPETQSSASEPERWRELDESWRELFTEQK